jgi:hypothetical protein
LLTLPQDDLAVEVSGSGAVLRLLASSSSAKPQLQFLQALAFLVVAHTIIITNVYNYNKILIIIIVYYLNNDSCFKIES